MEDTPFIDIFACPVELSRKSGIDPDIRQELIYWEFVQNRKKQTGNGYQTRMSLSRGSGLWKKWNSIGFRWLVASAFSSSIAEIIRYFNYLHIAPGIQRKIGTEIRRIVGAIDRNQAQATNLIDNKVRFTYLDARQSDLFEFPCAGYERLQYQLTWLHNLLGKKRVLINSIWDKEGQGSYHL